MTPPSVHADQLPLDARTVAKLIADQFPQWAHLPARFVPSSATVNVIVRLGDGLAARFPMRPDDAGRVRSGLVAEADAGRRIAAATAVPVPRPVAIGDPGRGYPLPWSVWTWVPGTTADEVDPSTSKQFARDLAAFIRDVRAVPTGGERFAGDGRGGTLADHDAWVAECLGRSTGLVDVPRLRELWACLRVLPRPDRDVLTHGDLIPGNVLVADGRLAGVLDVGGAQPADPALDLVCAWHLCDADRRRVLRTELDCEDAEWDRGRAWALQQALGLGWYYVDTNPAMSALGVRTCERLLADP